MCATYLEFIKARRKFLLDSLMLLEKQLLIFPVLVTTLACLSFFFSGCCAPWQWWTSVSLVLVVPMALRYKNRVWVLSDAMFLASLVLLWCLSPFLWDCCSNPDCQSYHLPMIHLLIKGWNPVSDPLSQGVLEQVGLNRTGMSFLHVAFVSKTAAVMSACAYFFVQDPYALMYPLVCFLSCSCFFAASRYFISQHHWWWGGAIVTWLLWRAFDVTMYVDVAVYFSFCGLAFTMGNDVRRNKLSVLRLCIFTFWLLNLKLSSALAAVVFWMVFGCAMLFKNRHQAMAWIKANVRKLALCVLVPSVSFITVSFNPYFTSLRDYGHPLYPFKTVNEMKFPQKDLTWDFKVCNADLEEMGYCGELVNAYVCPFLARLYYKIKLNRPDFSPHRYVWDYKDTKFYKQSPIGTLGCCKLMGALVLLLIIPGNRWFGVMMFVAFFLFPRQYMGFLRYQPWFFFFEVFALMELLWLIVVRSKKLSLILFGLCLVFCVIDLAAFCGRVRYRCFLENDNLDCVYCESNVVRSKSLQRCSYYQGCTNRYNSVVLLMRLSGRNGVAVRSINRNQMDEGMRSLVNNFGFAWDGAVSPHVLGGGRLVGIKRCLSIYARLLGSRFSSGSATNEKN